MSRNYQSWDFYTKNKNPETPANLMSQHYQRLYCIPRINPQKFQQKWCLKTIKYWIFITKRNARKLQQKWCHKTIKDWIFISTKILQYAYMKFLTKIKG